MATALRYFNEEVFNLLPAEVSHSLKKAYELTFKLFGQDIDAEHQYLTTHILKAIEIEKDSEKITPLIIEAAHLRGFLG
jgi:phosphoenolpyruvate carboxylase